jgi:hypothetical protein
MSDCSSFLREPKKHLTVILAQALLQSLIKADFRTLVP